MLFWKVLIPYYQISISCSLEDIDPIFKISRTFKTDLRDFWRTSFPKTSIFWISKLMRLPRMFFFKVIWIFLDQLESLGVSKSLNHENDRFSVSPIMKSKSYWSEMKQNDSTELWAISFPYIYQQQLANNAQKTINSVCFSFALSLRVNSNNWES